MNTMQAAIEQFTNLLMQNPMIQMPQEAKQEKTMDEQEREAVGNYAAAIARANAELMMFYFQKSVKNSK